MNNTTESDRIETVIPVPSNLNVPMASLPVTPTNSTSVSFVTALISGGIAGMCVDVTLYPIDTVKTRLQAPVGFWKAGGFRGIYRGLGAAAAGSAPGAALFFSCYESMKTELAQQKARGLTEDEGSGIENEDASIHMLAASIGEAAACLVRVPTEVVKAKMQTAERRLGLVETIRMVLQEGRQSGGGTANPLTSRFTGGLYRGYGITLFREIPFAAIQFPLFEQFKVQWSLYQREPVSPIQAACCGSIAGGIAAAATTPLDVLKTRLMLGADQYGVLYRGVYDVWQRTLAQDGWKALWSGIQPRVLWISIGGFFFFGSYEACKRPLAAVFG